MPVDESSTDEMTAEDTASWAEVVAAADPVPVEKAEDLPLWRRMQAWLRHRPVVGIPWRSQMRQRIADRRGLAPLGEKSSAEDRAAWREINDAMRLPRWRIAQLAGMDTATKSPDSAKDALRLRQAEMKRRRRAAQRLNWVDAGGVARAG